MSMRCHKDKTNLCSAGLKSPNTGLEKVKNHHSVYSFSSVSIPACTDYLSFPAKSPPALPDAGTQLSGTHRAAQKAGAVSRPLSLSQCPKPWCAASSMFTSHWHSLAQRYSSQHPAESPLKKSS